MKKLLYLISAILFIAISSCKKDAQHVSEDSGKKYSVNFNVAGFDQVIEPNAKTAGKKHTLAADTSLHNITIDCNIYKTDGAFVTALQTGPGTSDYPFEPDENYGKFKTELASGNYVAIFIARSDIYDVVVDRDNVYFDDHGIEDPTPVPENIYYKLVNFSVSPDTGGVSQTITLQRYIASLAVQVTDAIPANTKYITVSFLNIYGMKVFEDVPTDYFGGKLFQQNSESLLNKTGLTNYLFNTSANVFNTGGPVEVTITAYGTTGVIRQKVLPDVRFYKNTKTILRGKLFESNQTGNNAGFSTSFETFSPDSITSEF